jgi:hypothetical protein
MRRVLLSACATLLIALAGSCPAAAEGPNHPLLQVITSASANVPPLKDACGVAVDSKGYVYVASYYQHAIYVFGHLRRYLTQFANVDPLDGAIKEPLDGPCDLAFDSADNLYVNNWNRDVVKYTPSLPGSPIYTAGTVIDARHSTSVAVDPVTDRVYVDGRTAIGGGSYVAEYEPSGEPVLSEGEPVRIGLGSLGDGYGVAISHFGTPNGQAYVYVADAADATVKVYDPSVHPNDLVSEINGAGTPQGAFHLADADLAVDPSDGHLYVTDNLQPGFEHPELAVDELSARGLYRGRLPYAVAEASPTNLVNARLSAVTVADGEIFVTSGNDFVTNAKYEEAKVLVFGPAAATPTRILTVEKNGSGSGTVARLPSGWLRCGIACEGEFDQGAPVQLAATPDPHNRLVGWSGCESQPTPTTCFLRMSADAVVGAEFEPIPQQVLRLAKSGAAPGAVSSVPAGIDCGSACEGEFDQGSTVILTANPGPGSRLVGWDGCNSEPGPDRCAVTMTALRSVAVEFEQTPPALSPPSSGPAAHRLTVFAAGTGTATGRVDSEPAGIDCGAICTHVYEDGSRVTLVAHPSPNSSFLGWGGCDAAAADRCTLTLGTDKTVVAAYGPGVPGRLRLRRLEVRGRTASLEVGVPAPGALSASGSGLRPASALPLAPGPLLLHLRLSRKGANALLSARNQRLIVKVALTFVPFDGGAPVGATETVTFSRGHITRHR